MIPAVKDRLTQLGPVGRCVLLALVMGLALLVAIPIGFSLSAGSGVAAAIVAAVIVWLASALSIVIGEFFRGPNEMLAKLSLGMFLRISLPLAAILLVHLPDGPLATAGFVYFVLGFYFVALPVDTALAVSRIESRRTA